MLMFFVEKENNTTMRLKIMIVCVYMLVNYRAIGRIIYADYLRERLEAKDSVFTTLEKKKDQVLIEQLGRSHQFTAFFPTFFK